MVGCTGKNPWIFDGRMVPKKKTPFRTAGFCQRTSGLVICWGCWIFFCENVLDKTMCLRNFRPLALRRTLVGILQSQMLSKTAWDCEVLSQRLLTREEAITIKQKKNAKKGLQGNHHCFKCFLQSYCMPILCNDVLLAVSISCFVSWLLCRLSTKHFSSSMEGSFLSARAPKLKTGFCCVKFSGFTSSSLRKWVSWFFHPQLILPYSCFSEKLGVSQIDTFQIPRQSSIKLH